jgi:hypothetical protein
MSHDEVEPTVTVHVCDSGAGYIVLVAKGFPREFGCVKLLKSVAVSDE